MAKVKCNNCDNRFEEEDLTLFEHDSSENITAEETNLGVERMAEKPENPGYFRGCPTCKTDSYLMDVEEPETISTVDFFANTDWELLKKQKLALIKHISTVEKSGGKEDAECFEGLLNFLDYIQDHAVDHMGIDSSIVFNLTDDE